MWQMNENESFRMHLAITVGCKAELNAPLSVYVRAKLLSMR